MDRDLGAQSSLAGQGTALHGARLEPGAFAPSQPLPERTGGARDADLGLALIALRIEDDHQHWAAWMQLLAGDLLLRGHHPLSPPQVDVDRAAFDSIDHARR